MWFSKIQIVLIYLGTKQQQQSTIFTFHHKLRPHDYSMQNYLYKQEYATH